MRLLKNLLLILLLDKRKRPLKWSFIFYALCTIVYNSQKFVIECKGKSYAKSANSINKEGWLNALGQLVTRMNVKRYSVSKETGNIRINHAYKYGLGLYWQSAQVALRRIPKNIATVLCLHIFSINDNGEVKYFTPSQFGVKYPDKLF